jgi:hypothetical protein
MVRTDKLITTAFSNLARMEWYWCIFIPWTIYIHNNGIYMEHSLCPCTGMMWWSNLIEIWLLNKFSSRIYREENFLESWISTRLMMEKTLGCNSWSISGTCVNGEMEWRHQPQLLHKPGISRGCSLNSFVQTIFKRATQWSGKSQHWYLNWKHIRWLSYLCRRYSTTIT